MAHSMKYLSEVDLTRVHQLGVVKDVLLECRDGSIWAPKSVLIARSKYFEAMFNAGMSEANTNTISLKYVAVKAIEIILWYLYTEEIIIPGKDLVEDVLNVANLFLLDELTKQIFLATYLPLTCANVVFAWNWSANLQLHTEERNVKLFVAKNLKLISESPCFKYFNADKISKLICFVKYEEGKNVAHSAVSIESVVAFTLKWKMQFADVEEKKEISKLLSSVENPAGNQKSTQVTALTTDLLSKWMDFKHCARLVHSFIIEDGRARTMVYNEAKKQWGCENTVKLDTGIASSWFPVVSRISNDYFFFAVSNSKKYVAYNAPSNEFYFGLECSELDRDLTKNACNNEEIYFTESNDVEYCGEIILATKDNLYFDCCSENCVNIYKKSSKSWTKVIKPDSNAWTKVMKLHGKWRNVTKSGGLVGVKCKCFSGNCGVLIFIDQIQNKVMVYQNGEWETVWNQHISSIPVLANCDQLFILLKGKHKLYVYSPGSQIKWTIIDYPNNFDLKNCYLDLSFKCYC